MDMWFVRRLLKRRPSTILVSEIRDSRVFRTWNQDVSIELAHRVLSYGGVEVRFEWKVVKGKEAEGRKRAIELPAGSVRLLGGKAEQMSVRGRDRSDTERLKKY